MDFTPELSAFQGAIISADNVHQFSRLTSKGGNEEKVKTVIQNIKRFLQMENYIDENGLRETTMSNIRKFAMYIILNADLPVLEDMLDVAGIESLIWSIPTVPKYLLCELMWQLHMETFVYDIISKCWPQLGIEVAEAFLENFKYFGPTDCLYRLGRLTRSCYELLCRLTYFKIPDDILNGMLTTTFEMLQKFLKYYTDPPNKHRLNTLSSDDLYKYKGKRLENMLCLVYDCSNMFTQLHNAEFDDAIYKMTYNASYLHNTTYKVNESPSTLVLNYINNANIFLLDIFKEIVMDVSVDIFCAWSEFEDRGSSVQQIIGELCDKIQRKLLSISSLSEHPVVSMIQLMARKPTNINDIINSTDIETILHKINDNNEESVTWIHALANKDNLFQHIELVHVIDTNLSIFSDTKCLKLYNSLKTVTVNDDQREFFLQLKIKLFDRCNVTDKHNILKEHFKDKLFIDTLTSETDFDSKLNTMFNKFIANDDVDLTDILTVFYQNPRKVYTKIIGLASQNTQLIETMLNLMILLKDYTDYCYNTETESCMIKIIKHVLNTCVKGAYVCNVVKFICQLKSNNIISSSQLLMLIVMPSMHTALISADIRKLHLQLHLLDNAYSFEELLSYRAPLLVMMAQVMETVRLRIFPTYRVHGAKTLKIALKFQKSLLDTFKHPIPDTDGSWLKHKVRELSLHPLNFYYFRSLWNSDNRSYFHSVTQHRVHAGANLKILTLHLTQVIPWTILDEWCEVWDNLISGEIREKDVVRMYHAAVDVLNQRVNANRSQKTLACLFYCYGNLMHIIRYKFLKEPLTDAQVKACASLLSKSLRSTNAQDVGVMETVITPLFAYLAEKRNEYAVNVSRYFVNTRYYDLVNRLIPNEEMN